MYAESAPYDEGFLQVSDLHNIYYMQCGTPTGKPVLYLHGGPGGDISTEVTVYFNPEVYRIIVFSQRGAGKSTPTAELRENTTWDLVADTDKLRKHLSVDKWLVFGGSWGSTLALAYTETYPDRVKALILRGIFLVQRWELELLYQSGTSNTWPEEWERFVSVIPPHQRHDMIAAYHALLTSDDDSISLKAAQEWSRWEYSVSRLYPDANARSKPDSDLKWARAFARIECHYFINAAFMPDGHLVSEEQISKIRHIPCVIVNGRYDLICPMRTAYQLFKAYGDNCNLHVVPDAGHSSKESGTAKLLTEATDKFASL